MAFGPAAGLELVDALAQDAALHAYTYYRVFAATASGASVNLINGANPCNVFWQVGSSAIIGTGTTFVGNILALTSIALQTGASVNGRVLAQAGR
jgi:hypothetical protein